MLIISAIDKQIFDTNLCILAVLGLIVRQQSASPSNIFAVTHGHALQFQDGRVFRLDLARNWLGSCCQALPKHEICLIII